MMPVQEGLISGASNLGVNLAWSMQPGS